MDDRATLVLRAFEPDRRVEALARMRGRDRAPSGELEREQAECQPAEPGKSQRLDHVCIRIPHCDPESRTGVAFPGTIDADTG